MTIPYLSFAGFLIRTLIGFMFVLSGVLKIKAGSHWFLAKLLAFDLVRGRLARTLAKWLPWLEIVCGMFLIAGILLPLGTGVSFVLLLVFTTVIITAFLRDKKIDCGCFGQRTNSKTSYARWRIVYRNLVLMVLLVITQWLAPELTTNTWLNIGLMTVWLLIVFLTIVAHLWMQARTKKTELRLG